MKVLCVIPARKGSKGVKNKNKRRLLERPLVEYAIRTAKRLELIDTVVLSSDDEEIIAIAKKYDIQTPFTRPEHLAGDNAPLIAVVLHAFQYFRDRNIIFDAVLSLQPTSPFLRSRTVDRMISIWRKTRCDSIVTVAEIQKGHPYIAKRMLEDHTIEDFCPIPPGAVLGPRQKREKAYFLTGGAYLRDRALLERSEGRGHCLGEDSRAVVVEDMEAVDINIDIDFVHAEFLLKRGRLHDENSFL